MKEFLTQHWLLVFALFEYVIGFINGYLTGKRRYKQIPKTESEE